LRAIEDGNERMVDQNSASWNPLLGWLHQIDGLKGTAEARKYSSTDRLRQ
jgi:hypothetical protein